MASFWYSKGIKLIAGGTIDLDVTTLKIGLSTSVHVPNKDDQYCDRGDSSDFSSGEISVTGYVAGYGNSGRKTLTSMALIEDAVNDRIGFDAADVTWTSLASVVIEQATILQEVGSLDSSSPVIINNFLGGINPLGSDLPLQFSTSGIGYFQQ